MTRTLKISDLFYIPCFKFKKTKERFDVFLPLQDAVQVKQKKNKTKIEQTKSLDAVFPFPILSMCILFALACWSGKGN